MALLAFAALPACRRGEAPAARARRSRPAAASSRVIWVGLDGADPEDLDRRAAAGLMPSWRRISREGFRAPLESFEPMLSPLLWTTQETGLPPERHGVLDFTETDAASGRTVPVSEASRHAPAVWNVASSFGRRVGVVGFWATHPAEEVRGFFLSDRIEPLLFDGASSGFVFPKDLEEFVRTTVGREGRPSAADIAPLLGSPASSIEAQIERPGSPAALLARIAGATRVTQSLSTSFYDRFRPEFFAVYFEGTDEIGHVFAAAAPPRLPCAPPDFAARYGRVPGEYFRRIDAILGAWMARAKTDGAVLVVTSDHGFRWGSDRLCGRPSGDAATGAQWHRSPGIFAAWGDGIRPPERVKAASTFDVAPTLLALAKLPADRELPGRVIPVRPGLALDRRGGVNDAIRVRTLSPGAAARPAADEFANKLRALGYLSAGGTLSTESGARGTARPNARGWNNLGVYRLMTRRDAPAAIEAFREALRQDPQSGPAAANLALALARNGAPADAAAAVENAQKRAAPLPESGLLSVARELSPRSPRAQLRVLRIARRRFPGSEVAAREEALALFRLHRCGEAAKIVRPLESSKDPDTLNAAAVVETCAGRPGAAARLLRASLAIRPDQPGARSALAALP